MGAAAVAERKGKVESFEDLEVFQRAYRLSLVVHRWTLSFPAIEQHALGDQIRRASKSICANIAEGYGRQKRSKAEFKRFVAMAIGSADEMRGGFGRATRSISAISTRPHGRIGGTSIRSLRECCKPLWPAPIDLVSVLRPLLSVLRMVAERSVGRRRETREGSWRHRKCEC